MTNRQVNTFTACLMVIAMLSLCGGCHSGWVHPVANTESIGGMTAETPRMINQDIQRVPTTYVQQIEFMGEKILIIQSCHGITALHLHEHAEKP